MNLDIQIESFGITWEGPGIQKKTDSKELKNYLGDKMLEEGFLAKDLNTKYIK